MEHSGSQCPDAQAAGVLQQIWYVGKHQLCKDISTLFSCVTDKCHQTLDVLLSTSLNEKPPTPV